MGLHIVVARYNETLNFLDIIPNDVTYTIYNKGEDNISFPNVINVPNIGREAETYLRYIIDNYENLPDNIIFCQGSPNGHYIDFNHLLVDFNENLLPKWRKKILPLGLIVMNPVSMSNRIIHGMRVMDFIEKTMPNIKDEIFTLEWAYGAQYLVHKDQILNKSLEWWKMVYDLFMNEFEPETYITGSPWLYERLWLLIFDYEETK